MLIGLIASDCQWCQRAALQKGFEALGHEVTTDWEDPNVAFVFVGNPPYDPAILHEARAKRKKIVLNVLDLPTHNGREGQKWIDEWATQLPVAQRVTSISRHTQSQLLDICGIRSDVIYYPMKDVCRTGATKYPYKALLCGRIGDRNKRFHVALAALHDAGFAREQIAVVGPEDPRWGCTYLGVVDDQRLNDLYNSVDYVPMFDYNAGLGLPAIEAACAGAIPLVLPDLSTYDELWAGSPMGLFYQTFKDVESIETFLRYMEDNLAEKQIMKDAMYAYAQSHLAPKFDKVAVARRILDIYHTL